MSEISAESDHKARSCLIVTRLWVADHGHGLLKSVGWVEAIAYSRSE